jgi:dTDP-4-dehydrorhamnose reductase
VKIFILGANGMIGHKIYLYLNKFNYNVWGLSRSKFENIKFKQIFDQSKFIDNFDLCNFSNLNSILNTIKPDIIINAAGITIRRGIEADKSQTILVNSALPHILNQWINLNNNTRLIHFSTDCVFSGLKGNYNEKSIIDATDFYGKTKGLGEVNNNRVLTLRSSMIGCELDNFTELFEWFKSQKNQTIDGFSNVLYSGITTIRMAKYIKLIIEKFQDMNGLYNISSNPITKYELLKNLENKFNFNIKININENYYSNKVLNSSYFFNYIKQSQPCWSELIEEFYDDYKLNIDLYKK